MAKSETETGATEAEVMLPAVQERPPVDPYIGISATPFPQEASQKLSEAIPESDLDILPTGEIYASQVRYRRILNAAFGAGGWALMPRDNVVLDKTTNMMYRTWALYALGRFVSEATGEQQYQPDNDRMSYASAAEAVKSNALTRCCKDLGIASECWDKHFTEKFKAEHCVQVWREKERKPQWRRKDSAKFHDETGFVTESGGGSPPSNDPICCPKCGVIGSVRKGAAQYGGGWFCDKKKGGCGAKFTDKPQPPSGPDPADTFNPENNAGAPKMNPHIMQGDQLAFVEIKEVGKLATQFARAKGTNWDKQWKILLESLHVTKDTMTRPAYDAIVADINDSQEQPDVPY